MRIIRNRWFIVGAVIALLGMGLSLINFAIDEVVNPKLRIAPQAARRQRKAIMVLVHFGQEPMSLKFGK